MAPSRQMAKVLRELGNIAETLVQVLERLEALEGSKPAAKPKTATKSKASK